ncbi:MAG: hypothetical protein GF364_02965 [Candidatus Lokiarchaeota archaeon]|nr:hypothetical protein [Candidatus Lokiarchaeota archaeon]
MIEDPVICSDGWIFIDISEDIICVLLEDDMNINKEKAEAISLFLGVNHRRAKFKFVIRDLDEDVFDNFKGINGKNGQMAIAFYDSSGSPQSYFCGQQQLIDNKFVDIMHILFGEYTENAEEWIKYQLLRKL